MSLQSPSTTSGSSGSLIHWLYRASRGSSMISCRFQLLQHKMSMWTSGHSPIPMIVVQLDSWSGGRFWAIMSVPTCNTLARWRTSMSRAHLRTRFFGRFACGRLRQPVALPPQAGAPDAAVRFLCCLFSSVSIFLMSARLLELAVRHLQGICGQTFTAKMALALWLKQLVWSQWDLKARPTLTLGDGGTCGFVSNDVLFCSHISQKQKRCLFPQQAEWKTTQPAQIKEYNLRNDDVCLGRVGVSLPRLQILRHPEITSCLTNYSGNALGCMPPQATFSDGYWMSGNFLGSDGGVWLNLGWCQCFDILGRTVITRCLQSTVGPQYPYGFYCNSFYQYDFWDSDTIWAETKRLTHNPLCDWISETVCNVIGSLQECWKIEACWSIIKLHGYTGW